MRKIIKATVLTLVLALPVCAGDIGQPIAPPGEMGNPIASSTESTKAREIGCTVAGSEITITLLQTLLALF